VIFGDLRRKKPDRFLVAEKIRNQPFPRNWPIIVLSASGVERSGWRSLGIESSGKQKKGERGVCKKVCSLPFVLTGNGDENQGPPKGLQGTQSGNTQHNRRISLSELALLRECGLCFEGWFVVPNKQDGQSVSEASYGRQAVKRATDGEHDLSAHSSRHTWRLALKIQAVSIDRTNTKRVRKSHISSTAPEKLLCTVLTPFQPGFEDERSKSLVGIRIFLISVP
jgi:hypothetical protein